MKIAVSRIAPAAVALGMVAGLCGCSASAKANPRATILPSRGPAVTRPATPTPPAKPKPKPKLVLADTGVGGLYLGQSKKAALASGMVGRDTPGDPGADDDAVGCSIYHGKRGLQYVYFHQGKVIIIVAGPALKTDRGLGIGDTYRTLHEKYPEERGEMYGQVQAPAPGAKIKAHYRFGMDGSDDKNYPDDTVIGIALQGNSQPCYE
jgi:hypothetical protein